MFHDLIAVSLTLFQTRHKVMDLFLPNFKDAYKWYKFGKIFMYYNNVPVPTDYYFNKG